MPFLGDILYESASVAFDTTRNIFFNPVTKADLGPTPPASGCNGPCWPISFYVSAATGKVTAPLGPGGVAQTADQAAQMVATITQQLAAQSPASAPPVVSPVTAAPTATGYMQPSTAFDLGAFLSQYGLWVAGGLLAAMFLFGRGR